MSILTRISRLFKADIHSILDNLEQPEIILQQSVRDMQQEIDKADASLAELDKQQELLQQQHQGLTTRLQELQQQLHFCLSEDNDTLSKSVIRKKLQADLSLKELSAQLKHISEEKKLKIIETDERKEKLRMIRDKLALFTEKSEVNKCAPSSELHTSITQDDVELAFLYEKQCYAGTAGKGEKS